MEGIASNAKEYDLVSIQPNAIGAFTEPCKRIIAAGVPLVDIDTRLTPKIEELDILCFTEPDNDYMGAAVDRADLRRHQLRGRHRRDPRHAHAYRRPRPSPRLRKRGQEVPEDHGARSDPGQLGSQPGSRDLGQPARQVRQQDQGRLLPQRRHGARRPVCLHVRRVRGGRQGHRPRRASTRSSRRWSSSRRAGCTPPSPTPRDATMGSACGRPTITSLAARRPGAIRSTSAATARSTRAPIR